MKANKLLFKSTIAMGCVAFGIVILFYLAMTDIWHENGRLDFRHGQGPAAFEWNLISILYWPLLLFFPLFFLSVYRLAKDKKRN